MSHDYYQMFAIEGQYWLLVSIKSPYISRFWATAISLFTLRSSSVWMSNRPPNPLLSENFIWNIDKAFDWHPFVPTRLCKLNLLTVSVSCVFSLCQFFYLNNRCVCSKQSLSLGPILTEFDIFQGKNRWHNAWSLDGTNKE